MFADRMAAMRENFIVPEECNGIISGELGLLNPLLDAALAGVEGSRYCTE